jgi:hypothetical protein
MAVSCIEDTYRGHNDKKDPIYSSLLLCMRRVERKRISNLAFLYRVFVEKFLRYF